MPDQLRTPCAILAAALAVLLAGGCLGTRALKSDVLAGREGRFADWRSEKRGEDVQRPTLSGPLSLDDGIMTALRNSRQMQLAALERVKAAARIEEAYSEALPYLDLGATYTRLDQAPTASFNGSTVALGSPGNYALTAKLSQPLYSGGAFSAGLRGARIYSVLVDEQMRGTRQAVIFAARKAYYDARLALELKRASADAVSVARAGYYPKMDAFVEDEETKPDPHNETLNSWGNAWSAGLSLTYRVFDGFKTRSQVRQAEAQLEQYEVTLRDTEERTLLQIKQAILGIEDASKEVAAQQANVEEAKEAQRLAELGFSQGVRLQVEVLDAQRALTSSEATCATAVYNHELARLQLEQAASTLEAPSEDAPQEPLAPPSVPPGARKPLPAAATVKSGQETE